jgi:hypothetical protein
MEELSKLFESRLGIWEALVPIAISLIASVIVYFMYQLFYGSRNIGAGVHRTFIIGGPAITTLFLGIQTSIPLSLGLLGALSFVRFRTPVKDPAEIGFLLLLIAASIGIATNNYLITGLLFVVVFIALGVAWLTRNKITLFGRGHLMISVEQASFQTLEKKLTEFLKQKLTGLTLETISTHDNRVGLQYQYRKQSGFDWPMFTSELNQLAGAAKIELYVS